MRLRNKLILIMICSLTLDIVILFLRVEWLQIVLGIPFLAFFPGYTFMKAIFPARRNFSFSIRLLLSIGLSLAIIPIIGLFLNYTWGISLYPILFTTTFFILVTSTIALFRAGRLSENERSGFSIKLEFSKWKIMNLADKTLIILLLLGILTVVGSSIHVFSKPKDIQFFTEFFILNSSGKAGDYPEIIYLDSQVSLLLNIISHEQDISDYQVEIKINNNPSSETIGPITLYPEQKWQKEISITPTVIGDKQKLEFLMYKDKKNIPDLSLDLLIDVKPPISSK